MASNAPRVQAVGDRALAEARNSTLDRDVIMTIEAGEGAMHGPAALARISIGLLAVAFLAGGCTIPPPATLLSPLEVAQGYARWATTGIR
jgi:hypothetical protein